ncbi:MAG: hypothetical protein WD049_06620, partial [Candidatus Paceibacterota bacterium]
RMQGRQADYKLTPVPRPIGEDLDGSIMETDQVGDHRQPNANAPFRTVQRTGDLSERVENPWQHFRRDADAGIAELDDDFVVLLLRLQQDLAPFVGVLGSIVQQVSKNLD